MMKEEEEEEEEVDDYIDGLTFKINDDITLNQLEILHIYACVHWAKKYNGERWNKSEIRDLIGHAMLNLDDDKYKEFDLSNLFKTFRDRNNPDTIKAEDRAEDIHDTLLAQIKKLESSPSFVTPSRLTAIVGWLIFANMNPSFAKKAATKNLTILQSRRYGQDHLGGICTKSDWIISVYMIPSFAKRTAA